MRWWCVKYQFAGAIAQVPFRHDHVDQAHAFAGTSVDGASAQNQVHGLESTEQWHHAGTAAPAGVYSQLDFRQSESGTRIITGHPVTAGQ